MIFFLINLNSVCHASKSQKRVLMIFLFHFPSFILIVCLILIDQVILVISNLGLGHIELQIFTSWVIHCSFSTKKKKMYSSK